MLNITTEVVSSQAAGEKAASKKVSLKQYVLKKPRTWVNGLLEAERVEFLGRGRHQPLDEEHDNYRNGYRPRRINFFGLGEIELRLPRDRRGKFESAWLPERKSQDAELEAFLAEAFLAGLSTRDLARITEKHLGQKYDSKHVSRIVARATTELEAWRQRRLDGPPRLLQGEGAEGPVVSFGRAGDRTGLGFAAHVLSVRSYVLDRPADHQSH